MGLTYVLSKGPFVDSPPAFKDTPNIEPSLKNITISAGELAGTPAGFARYVQYTSLIFFLLFVSFKYFLIAIALVIFALYKEDSGICSIKSLPAFASLAVT